jgi:hypothetical protein
MVQARCLRLSQNARRLSPSTVPNTGADRFIP